MTKINSSYSITPSATILHLSDLHLGKNFQDIGGKHKSSVSSLWKRGGLTMQAHDPYILPTLSMGLRSAARFINGRDDQFDLYLLTGDISANSDSIERFQFAARYLTAEVVLEENQSIGLNIPTNKLLCVPGNHDKINEASKPIRYSKVFKKYPDTVPYVRIIKIQESNQRFLFYGIDSNLYEEGNIAVGEITPETFAWLSNQFDEQSKAANLDESLVRILILHHHPADLNRFRKFSIRYLIHRFFSGRLTRLEEGERLLKLCKGHIDIICHGHEHFPISFVDDLSRCVIVSAGTASQFQVKKYYTPNSFHCLAFYNRNVSIFQFDWNGAMFKKTNNWDYDLDYLQGLQNL